MLVLFVGLISLSCSKQDSFSLIGEWRIIQAGSNGSAVYGQFETISISSNWITEPYQSSYTLNGDQLSLNDYEDDIVYTVTFECEDQMRWTIDNFFVLFKKIN